jgi:hypothetical protein
MASVGMVMRNVVAVLLGMLVCALMLAAEGLIVAKSALPGEPTYSAAQQRLFDYVVYPLTAMVVGVLVSVVAASKKTFLAACALVPWLFLVLDTHYWKAPGVAKAAGYLALALLIALARRQPQGEGPAG